MLSPEVSTQLTAMLERMRDALLAQKPVRGDAERTSEPEDAAQAGVLGDDAASLANRGDVELDRIYRALGRLELGEADVCTVCGEAIPPARLLANPLADTCIADQRAIERGEHLANPGGTPSM